MRDKRWRKELVMRGSGALGPILLGAGVSLSIDGRDHATLAYAAFYGLGLVLLGVSLALWHKLNAPPGTEREGDGFWARHPLAGPLGICLVAGAVGLIGGLAIAPGGEAEGDTCLPQALTRPSGRDLAVQRIPPPNAGRPQALDPIPMREDPRSVAVGSDGVWVTQATDQSVSLIDPKLNRPVGAPIDVEENPFAIGLAEDVAWVTREDGMVVAIDRKTRKIVRRYSYGTKSGEVALGAGSVWVNNYEEHSPGVITRIDPCTGEIDRIPVGRRANTVKFAFGSVWVSDSASALHRLDPATEEPEEIPLPDSAEPMDVGAGGGYVWVVSFGPQELFKIDPREEKVVGKPIPIGSEAAGAVVAAGSVWLPNHGGNSVTRVDLRTLRSEPNAVNVGASPTDIAAGFGRIWVTNNTNEPPSVTPIQP